MPFRDGAFRGRRDEMLSGRGNGCLREIRFNIVHLFFSACS
jgi:hypothetical protein